MTNCGVGSINHFRKKLTNTHEFISTAYHEAGHTVYGLLHFMKVGSVSVFENKKTKRFEGFTHYEVAFHDEMTDRAIVCNIIKNEICISYAGLNAEKYLFKIFSGSDKFPMFLRDGSSDDTLSASELIRKFEIVPPGPKRYAFKQKMIKETLNELKLYWCDVTLVAHTLFQRKKLSYFDLKSLLTKKSQNKKFWKKQFKQIDIIFDNIGDLDEKELKYILGL
jgi:hypothetical protein